MAFSTVGFWKKTPKRELEKNDTTKKYIPTNIFVHIVKKLDKLLKPSHTVSPRNDGTVVANE